VDHSQIVGVMGPLAGSRQFPGLQRQSLAYIILSAMLARDIKTLNLKFKKRKKCDKNLKKTFVKVE